jgi:hypothetical protein
MLLRKMLLLLLPMMMLLGIAAASRLAMRMSRPDPTGLALAPDALDFGRVAIGASGTRQFILTNLAPHPLSLERMEVDRPFEFPWGGRSFEGSVPLEPGESHALSVSFRPSESGPVEGVLRVRGGGRELAVPLHAVGHRPPEIEVAPSSLSFGEVGVGSAATGLLTIHNRGEAELRLAIQSGAPFQAETQERSVPPGAELAVQVAFAPSRAGKHQAWLEIQSNDPRQEELRIHLRGIGGRMAPAPRIEASASRLEFGAAGACETRESSLRITNRGADTLSIASVSAPLPFSAASGSRRIEPGRSLELAVAFSPTDAGSASGRLLIHSNDLRAGVVSVDLRGEGSAPCARTPSGRTVVAVAPRDGRRLAGIPGSVDGAQRNDSRGAEKVTDERAAEPPEPGSEQAVAVAPPPVRSGSRIRIGSNESPITPDHVTTVRLDPTSGLLSLDGLALPRIEFPYGEYFEFAATGAQGRVDSLGEAELRVPLEIVDSYGDQTKLEVPLTTGTARTRNRGMLFTRAGEPFASDGDATLVGLVTFPSGTRLEGFKLEIVLNVHAAR